MLGCPGWFVGPEQWWAQQARWPHGLLLAQCHWAVLTPTGCLPPRCCHHRGGEKQSQEACWRGLTLAVCLATHLGGTYAGEKGEKGSAEEEEEEKEEGVWAPTGALRAGARWEDRCSHPRPACPTRAHTRSRGGTGTGGCPGTIPAMRGAQAHPRTGIQDEAGRNPLSLCSMWPCPPTCAPPGPAHATGPPRVIAQPSPCLQPLSPPLI